jgi:hypothetical protein
VESDVELEPDVLESDVLEPDVPELEPLPEPEPDPLPEPEPLPVPESLSPEPDSPPLPPPAAAFTLMVPFMNGWGVHMYWNVPAVSKVAERLLPFPNVPVSKLPSSAVAEWATSSVFRQVTESPTSIVIDFGENAKSCIVTVVEAAALATGRERGRTCSRSSPRSCTAGGGADAAAAGGAAAAAAGCSVGAGAGVGCGAGAGWGAGGGGAPG